VSRTKQGSLFDETGDFSAHAAVADRPAAVDADARGAFYTRPEVVGFILNLIGYQSETPLFRRRILEPSFGGGDFLHPIVDRLLESFAHFGRCEHFTVLRNAIRAVELHRPTYVDTCNRVLKQLAQAGFTSTEAEDLTRHWLVCGDFLLTQLGGSFDYVAANPPYVRQELIPAALLSEYRRRYRTIYDRADLYVPFIERSLSLLGDGGVAGFICSDRWMKNRYGGPLRSFVADAFHLQCYVDMTGTDAFHSEVTAYPAITVLRRARPGTTRIARQPRVDVDNLATLAHDLFSPRLRPGGPVTEMESVVNGNEPWLIDASGMLETVRLLECRYPTLEEAGCKVGIGVATGADQAFIGEWNTLDVESDRKLPLVTTEDIRTGEVAWLGRGVINPFGQDGRLVDLTLYPRLKRYLEDRRDIIASRHCARKTPNNWYRTIDRIWEGLAGTPKLLIPDIKGGSHVVYEDGRFYPHHNLYYVTSEAWDLRALQAVLLSRISLAIVAAYSTKMRGGYLRFQAQYLRRIRLPRWTDVPGIMRTRLSAAAEKRDLDACDQAAFDLYGMNNQERAVLAGAGAEYAD